jgi:transcriptional regulator
MYLPAAFAVTEPELIAEAITSIAAGHLVTSHDGAFDSSFLPLLADTSLSVLHGHLARANPHGRAIAAAGEAGVGALVILGGPDAYVSPAWYPSKAESGEVVPTWNFEVVHVHGRVRVVDDAAFVADVVRRLTDRHEARRLAAAPGGPPVWSVDDAPADYLARMHRAIVGVELRIDRIEAKRKLSQNRPDDDRAAVRRALAGGSPRDQAVAGAMAAADDHGEVP